MQPFQEECRFFRLKSPSFTKPTCSGVEIIMMIRSRPCKYVYVCVFVLAGSEYPWLHRILSEQPQTALRSKHCWSLLGGSLWLSLFLCGVSKCRWGRTNAVSHGSLPDSGAIIVLYPIPASATPPTARHVTHKFLCDANGRARLGNGTVRLRYEGWDEAGHDGTGFARVAFVKHTCSEMSHCFVEGQEDKRARESLVLMFCFVFFFVHTRIVSVNPSKVQLWNFASYWPCAKSTNDTVM